MNITIGENIKRLRNTKQVTQETLSAALGVTPQAISRWEAGNGFPAIEYLPDIAMFFGISVDELLGVKLTEREAKREDIYATISHIEECGYNTSAIDLLREAHEEFPSDRNISFALAKALASTRFDDEVDDGFLKQAERILRDLIKQADDYDFRCACVKELAVLYKDAWKDDKGYEEISQLLPELDSCREIFVANYNSGTTPNTSDVKKSVVALTQRLIAIIRDYVSYTLPNPEERWEEKIDYLYHCIDYCRTVEDVIGEEESIVLENSIGVLYRYIATYRMGQNNVSDTIDCLNKMCDCIEKICDKGFDDKTGMRSDSPNNFSGEKRPHNIAWYIKPHLKQDRYDSIRDTEQFQNIVERLDKMSK